MANGEPAMNLDNHIDTRCYIEQNERSHAILNPPSFFWSSTYVNKLASGPIIIAKMVIIQTYDPRTAFAIVVLAARFWELSAYRKCLIMGAAMLCGKTEARLVLQGFNFSFVSDGWREALGTGLVYDFGTKARATKRAIGKTSDFLGPKRRRQKGRAYFWEAKLMQKKKREGGSSMFFWKYRF